MNVQFFMKKIKELRRQKGYTQKKLSELSGVEYSMLNKYENGIKIPSFITLQKIAKALDCDVRKFYGESIEHIRNEELLDCAQPLIKLLRSKGNPMMVVHVTEEGVDLYEAVCGTEDAHALISGSFRR